MQDQEPTYVVLRDIDIDFLDLVMFNLKGSLATIPVMVIWMLFMGAIFYFLDTIGLFPASPGY